ncbi:MAG: phenylalanine--tRNA ligase subunit alpha [archaeon]
MLEKTLHPIEKKVLIAVGGREISTVDDLVSLTSLKEVEVMRALQWLGSKDLIEVKRDSIEFVKLKDESFTFPERGALKQIVEKPTPVKEIDRAAVTWLFKRGWADIVDNTMYATDDGKAAVNSTLPDERLLSKLKQAGELALSQIEPELLEGLELLKQRPRVIQIVKKAVIEVKPSKKGLKLYNEGITIEDEVNQLTHEMLASKSWASKKFRRYDLAAPVPQLYPGKRHPLQKYIDKVRTIFLEMGFEERAGPLIESAFWNFDALFQPQDHPARDLADTFYLSKPATQPIPYKYVPEVKAMHEHGAESDSTGWQYQWREDEAKKAILRTHTTAVTVRALSEVKPPAKVFCLGRVFRNETLDYSHLAEFHQVDGIVVDENVTFRNLLGYLKEFYERMGFKKVRFRPAYFPYTEMSVEPEVYFKEKKQWIELGGSGMFRPEVTEPFGIKCPVLAWGLGLERLVMLTEGLDDLRDLYRNDLTWLRQSHKA